MSETTPAFDPEYLAPPRTAALIDRSVAALAMDRSRGVGLPYVKVGQVIRYRRQDIEEYMQSHLVVPAARRAS